MMLFGSQQDRILDAVMRWAWQHHTVDIGLAAHGNTVTIHRLGRHSRQRDVGDLMEQLCLLADCAGFTMRWVPVDTVEADVPWQARGFGNAGFVPAAARPRYLGGQAHLVREPVPGRRHGNPQPQPQPSRGHAAEPNRSTPDAHPPGRGRDEDPPGLARAHARPPGAAGAATNMPKYQQIAAEVAQLYRQDLSVAAIARGLDVSKSTVSAALNYANVARRSRRKGIDREAVYRLWRQGYSKLKISRMLGCSDMTVAYHLDRRTKATAETTVQEIGVGAARAERDPV
ncbi:MAG TPA: helix-turn-helix domain-containing protein [Candidatus Limnocylindrales bacterium]|nr:helix-turn-helix domain-containing protein [Candidatus Limnocylindrales bacterium]